MTKPRYSKVISMNQEQYLRLEALISKGYKVIDVFNAGMCSLESISAEKQQENKEEK